MHKDIESKTGENGVERDRVSSAIGLVKHMVLENRVKGMFGPTCCTFAFNKSEKCTAAYCASCLREKNRGVGAGQCGSRGWNKDEGCTRMRDTQDSGGGW